MSTFSFKQAFGATKPHHSSVTDWIEILTGPSIAEEAYDGIPELVDAINLQKDIGSAEASRALRKKLKHGNIHQQYRALVLLKALVENCGSKFHNAVNDGQFTDALRHIASDSYVDRRVKKKLSLVLAAWRTQYKDDPSMSFFANLYTQCRISERKGQNDAYQMAGVPNLKEDEKKMEKRKLKEEKRAAREKAAKEEEERRKNSVQQGADRTRRTRRFDFEKDKPKVLESLVAASQASSNLMNAITLVNLQKETLEENARVQECVEKAKQAKKTVMAYTRLVENEDLIGTLIESTERVVSALNLYDELVSAGQAGDADATDALTTKLAAAQISHAKDEEAQLLSRTNSYSNAAEHRSQQPPRQVHPDLEDLDFLGGHSNRLPPPMQPSKAGAGNSSEEDEVRNRGSLSDFSDYESSDEEMHNARAGTSTGKKAYVTVSDDEDDVVAAFTPKASTSKAQEDDPFADPFADEPASGSRR
ncbi:hypothetical protein BKA70DRAFT_317973 [Coprinopsis sp. MPI-PUGE-AT-0042]|nr:hypothetical protein BKA70DRAFT_317973 [Coprinopsis sp. MPI-PUGE-AT-0042]